jgi:hypothetical protein
MKRAVHGTALQMPGRDEKGAGISCAALPAAGTSLGSFDVSCYEPETSERRALSISRSTNAVSCRR